MDVQFSVQYLAPPMDGSASRRVQQFRQMNAEKAKVNKESKRSWYLGFRNAQPARQSVKTRTADLLSIGAMATACVMLLVMLVGIARLGNINSEADRMESYAAELQQEYTQLQEQYRSGYDLEQIRIEAEAMGLVPVEEDSRITISINKTQQPELTLWDRVGMFLAGLFA